LIGATPVHEPAVRADALTVGRRGRPVLADLSLTVPTGALVGLLGPSGSGKTTLLRTIVGAQRITAGTLTVLGAPAGSPSLRDRIGYTGQSGGVYDDLTPVENLRYFATVLAAPAADVDRVLAAVHLEGLQNRPVGRLSGGQRTRVSLAVALLGHPQLLVLDEPTVGLDPVLRADLWSLFRDLAARGVTLIVSSHVMDEAARCDRVLILRDGRLLIDATPAGLLHRTGAHDAEDAFIALARETSP